MASDEQGIYDSTDPAAIEAARRAAGRREKDDDETIKVWMNHPNGRDLLYRITFAVCHLGDLFTASDEQGRTDTHRTFLHLGERNIGAWFDERMKRHPKLYMEMLAEQEVLRQARDIQLRKQNEKQDELNG